MLKNRLVMPYALLEMVAFFAVCAPASGKDGQSVRDLEDRLHGAIRNGGPETVLECMKDLARTGDPRAYRAIIRYGLSGTSHEIEKYAGGLLVNADSPEVIQLVLTQARSNRNYRTRIVLLAVVSRWAAVDRGEDGGGEPSKLNELALQVLLDAIGDRARPVALAAVQWIREVGRRESIGPLITQLESLEGRRKGRLYFDIRKALEELSGHDFKVSGDWRNWWEVAKTSKDLRQNLQNAQEGAPREKKRRSKTVLYRAPPTFFSVPVETDRVLFVIDVSQSMLVRDPELPPDPFAPADRRGDRGRVSGATAVAVDNGTADKGGSDDSSPGVPDESRERLFRVKKELMKVIEALPERTRFGVLRFSHQLRFWRDSAILQGATPSRKDDAVSWVESLQAYGATRTDLALAQALRVPAVDTIYLLTDGRPRDESNRKIPVEAVLQMVKRENRFKRCRIHTISFRQVKSADMTYFVRELAKQNDGVCTLLR